MDGRKFDTIVIGSGTSASLCISALADAGRKIAVVDERPYGGTCALRGCQPKKYLVANAEAVAMARHLSGVGLTHPPRTDWAALQALKNEFIEGIPEREVEEFGRSGITTLSGRATLVGPDEVEVGGDRYRADHIVLATGAVPRRSTFEGSEHTRDSEHFLNMPELPERILFIGGGYISYEFAFVAAYAGAQAVILHRSARPLKQFDPDMVDLVVESGAAAGVRTIVDESPVRIEKAETGYVVLGASGERYEADLVIEATGRLPNLSVLEGDLGGVEHTPRGVTVDACLRSVSNPRVYAIGDCAARGAMLAPVADEEGKVAAQNILTGDPRPVDDSVVPSAAFTIPTLAAVGLTEEQATEKGLDFRLSRDSTTGWPSSRRIGEKHAGYKVLISREDDSILGAHLARHNAAEVVNIFALAMKFGIKARDLSEFLWAYPTYASDLKYMVR